MKKLLALLLAIMPLALSAQDTTATKRVYKFDIKEEIGPGVWRKMQKAFAEADDWSADLILLHMNTYGGMVLHADSMRTKILNSKIPVWVFIDNNAASAGALISIACDSIYMRKGANIGAATVVNQTGEEMPDKYQSYMRSTMRATAEAKSRDRDIAQAMVDESISIDGISDSGKVLTFTASEAMLHGFCEGMAESVAEVMALNGITDYEIKEFTPTQLDEVIGWLIHPAVSGILIMIVIGGIYFELQSPGVGFPIAASIIAATLYFAPLYLEGLAENWEIIVFLAGIVLVAVEVFVLPGFGVAGISGIILIMAGLMLSMVGNVGFDFEVTMPGELVNAGLTVVMATVIGLFGSIMLAKRLLSTSMLSHLVLASTQQRTEGFIGVDATDGAFVGREGIAYTVLRPSGKVEIDGDIHDATAMSGFIDKGETVKVVKHETAQLFVRKITAQP
jgi:membrane-bound serine protease (ClpP class)